MGFEKPSHSCLCVLAKADAFFRRSCNSIALLTVQDILEEHLAKNWHDGMIQMTMTLCVNNTDPNERKWNRNFERLVVFHRIHGHFKLPSKGDFSGVYHWIATQCLLKRFNLLRPERQQRLEELGFDWDRRRRNEEPKWERYFRQLMEFHQTHGHFEVPDESPTSGLLRWVTEQRELQQNGQLPANCRQRLEAEGFSWLKPDSFQEQAWNRNFARLMEYHQTHVDFRMAEQMPRNSGLRRWIRDQRLLHRLHRLRPDRQQRLEAAGFTWDPPQKRELTEKLWQAVREPLLKNPPSP
jgi:hypothetical protein